MPSYCDAADGTLKSGRIWPRAAEHNGRDCRLADAILPSQMDLEDPPGSVSSPDLPDLCRGQFGEFVPFPSLDRFRMKTGAVSVSASQSFGIEAGGVPISHRRAAFRCHVGHVSRLGAEPEVPAPLIQHTVHLIGADVVIPDTDAHVAGMKHLQAGWDRLARSDSPGSTMRIRSIEAAVSGAPGRTDPQPTLVTLVDLLGEPKNLPFDSPVIGQFGAGQTTEPALTGVGLIHTSSELYSAMSAGTRDGTLTGHRDHSSVLPRPVASRTGASCVNYTPYQIGGVA